MRPQWCAVAAAVMLAGSVGLAAAQTGPGSPAGADPAATVNLTQAQEQTIVMRLEEEPAQAVAAVPEVGAKAPEDVALKRLPSDVGAQIPEAEKFHYAKLADQVVLVDPASREIVKVIRPRADGATGGASANGAATSGSSR